jgi:hypothetical protein
MRIVSKHTLPNPSTWRVLEQINKGNEVKQRHRGSNQAELRRSNENGLPLYGPDSLARAAVTAAIAQRTKFKAVVFLSACQFSTTGASLNCAQLRCAVGTHRSAGCARAACDRCGSGCLPRAYSGSLASCPPAEKALTIVAAMVIARSLQSVSQSGNRCLLSPDLRGAR